MTFKVLYVNIKTRCYHSVQSAFFLFPKDNYSLFLDLEQFSKVFEIFQTDEELLKHALIT